MTEMTELLRDPGEEPPDAVDVDGAQVRPRETGRRRPQPLRWLRFGLNGVAAVGVKELRGRMRGRRAFVILTFYLLLLAGFAWAWELIAERTYGSSGSLYGGSAAFASRSSRMALRAPSARMNLP